jgi:amino acid adenylation domain-containing protein
MTSVAGWLEQAAAVLAIGYDDLRAAAGERTFVELGGTSLGALELISRGDTVLRETVDLALLLGQDPLKHVLDKAVPSTSSSVTAVEPAQYRPLLPGQASMLAAEDLQGSTAYHLLFSAEISGPLDRERLLHAIGQLVGRHESLRTAFVVDQAGRRCRQVQAGTAPRIVEQYWPGAPTIDAIHAPLTATGSRLIDAGSQVPPVCFVHTTTAEHERSVLSLIVHHALVDGWAIGILWRELALLYDAADLPAAPQPEAILAQADLAAADGRVARLAAQRSAQLALCSDSVRLPTELPRADLFTPESERLVFEVPAAVRAACDQLAKDAGVTHTAVLMTCWALSVARRCDLDELLVGLPVAWRATPSVASVVGLCTRIVPVHCVVSAGSIRSTVRAVAAAISEALTYADVPFDELVTAAGAGRDLHSAPLVQVTFASHEQFVPERLESGPTSWQLHEGHCRGTAFDATLFVQRWDETGRLALEYSVGSMTAQEAAALAEGFVGTLTELTRDPESDILDVRGMSERQQALLTDWQQGPELDSEQLPGLWELLARTAAGQPTDCAVRTADVKLTFAELYAEVEDCARRLYTAGVREGSAVLIAVPRGVQEIVAILGVLRLGACYVGVSGDDPPQRLGQIVETARPVAVIGELPGSVASGIPVVDAVRRDSGAVSLPELARDLERVSCLAFTSGSTGTPKCTPIPERAIVRLIVGGDYLQLGRGDRMLRLAPLAFDASTLEIFSALGHGAGLEVFPGTSPHPGALADFLSQRAVTHAWLTAGLFRLVADHRPAAFATLKVLLTGGDVVPEHQVRQVLTACPELCLVNGYGPTENTVFSTVKVIDSALRPGPIPIGRPIAGTSVVLLDSRGRQVPPGGLGEIVCGGLGVARGYLDGGTAFTTDDSGVTRYHSGDLAFWTGAGELAFAGRRDRQLKLAGHRIEPAGIEAVLREHPGVRDVVIVVEETPTSGRRLVAAVLTDQRPDLAEELAAAARAKLPTYAVPARWLLLNEYPLTGNGKLDLAALLQPGEPQTATAPDQDLTAVVLEVWAEVLGHDDFDADDRFFDVGGSSLALTEVRNLLRHRLPGTAISALALFRHPTPRGLAAHLTTEADHR